MQKFILGYLNEPLSNELIQFSSAKHAINNAEEWVEVEAENLENAKSKYEQTFTDWQKKNGLYLGED